MKDEISNKKFDIALIGCGAYGLPLAGHVKRLGKIGIHMGGCLQLLFGIKGKRWDNNPSVNKFYNDNWVRPSNNDIPKLFKSREWLLLVNKNKRTLYLNLLFKATIILNLSF